MRAWITKIRKHIWAENTHVITLSLDDMALPFIENTKRMCGSYYWHKFYFHRLFSSDSSVHLCNNFHSAVDISSSESLCVENWVHIIVQKLKTVGSPQSYKHLQVRIKHDCWFLFYKVKLPVTLLHSSFALWAEALIGLLCCVWFSIYNSLWIF